MKKAKTEQQKKAKNLAALRYYYRNKDKYYWYQRNRYEKLRADNPELLKKKRRIAENKFNSTPRGKWHIMKSNSRKRGHQFTIQLQDFLEWYQKQPQVCEYCGRKERTGVLGLDRIINELPYQFGNMALCCYECNSTKGALLSYKEMKVIGQVIMSKRI